MTIHLSSAIHRRHDILSRNFQSSTFNGGNTVIGIQNSRDFSNAELKFRHPQMTTGKMADSVSSMSYGIFYAGCSVEYMIFSIKQNHNRRNRPVSPLRDTSYTKGRDGSNTHIASRDIKGCFLLAVTSYKTTLFDHMPTIPDCNHNTRPEAHTIPPFQSINLRNEGKDR